MRGPCPATHRAKSVTPEPRSPNIVPFHSPWDFYSSNKYFLSTHYDPSLPLGPGINQVWSSEGENKLG